MMPSSVRALLLFSSLPGLSLGLSMSAPTILSISVPRYIMEGSEAVLTCNYRYHSQPYSVRWYKNGKEFYSFVADKAEPRAVHSTLGVTVDLARSGSMSVGLSEVSALTTGRFRCEVSGEAPMFATDTKYSDLTVVSAPASGPQITGARPSYHVREPVSVTCDLRGSRPAANLTWYINNQRVSQYLYFCLVASSSLLGLNKLLHKTKQFPYFMLEKAIRMIYNQIIC